MDKAIRPLDVNDLVPLHLEHFCLKTLADVNRALQVYAMGITDPNEQ